jgi:hypothetical protein
MQRLPRLGFKPLKPGLKQRAGCTLVFAAAVCFYLSTVGVRRAHTHLDMDPALFVFTRFFLGFVIVCVSIRLKRGKLNPKRCDLPSGSIAIILLNLSRKYHDTETILFCLFGIGSIVSYAAFSQAIHWPDRAETCDLVLGKGERHEVYQASKPSGPGTNQPVARSGISTLRAICADST